jgi:hypothetical protein
MAASGGHEAGRNRPAQPMINASEVLKTLEDTDPILMAVLGTAMLGVCAWSATIFAATRSKRTGRTRSRGKVKHGPPRAAGMAQANLGALVEALRADDRHGLGHDLVRLIEGHRNKRFQTFVVVRRATVSPVSFAFLYQTLRAHNRPTAEVHEFQISVRDANELLRACTAESART